MTEAIANKFIFNDKLYNVNEFDKLYKNINPSVYEVLRIDKGIPLFLEDHFSRLRASIEIIGYALNLSIEQLSQSLSRIILENKIATCNVKIVINGFDTSKPNLYIFFIESHYPEALLYTIGINTITYNAVRENPNAKVIYVEMRKNINLRLEQLKCYEALLVDTNNNVTEGSRSNLFFIKGDTVYTSKGDEVLIGITRIKIMQLCKQNGINVNEASISLMDLDTFDACFISGTSPKVLPIRKIDDLEYNTNNEVLLNIIKLYNNEIEAYYKTHK